MKSFSQNVDNDEKSDEDGNEHTKNWMLTSFWCFKSNQATFEMSKLKRFLINVCNCQWVNEASAQGTNFSRTYEGDKKLDAERWEIFLSLNPEKLFCITLK